MLNPLVLNKLIKGLEFTYLAGIGRILMNRNDKSSYQPIRNFPEYDILEGNLVYFWKKNLRSTSNVMIRGEIKKKDL